MKDNEKTVKRYPFDGEAANNVAEAMNKLLDETDEPNEFDPFGSYTGCPEDPEETPVQDADDL